METDEPGVPDQETRRAFADSELHRLMGLSLESLGPGFARVAMTTSPFTQGGIGGSVHGGLLAALVDIVALRAVITLVRDNERPAGTADLSITYLRQALGSRIYADATVLRKGRQLAVIEVSVVDENGVLCAKGRCLYALRPLDR